MIINKSISGVILPIIAIATWACGSSPEISGELKTWHKIALTFEGPQSAETATPNPFTDYRLEVTFTQNDKKYVIPGHFAADGQSAYTSASGGNKWRVYFSPGSPGTWQYEVSFRQGPGVAVSGESGESAGFMDGQAGTFEVNTSDKTGRDFRAHGRLQYVGEHYMQFAASGQYFLKCGADAPENLLAYYEIDNTPNVGNRLKKWPPHQQDYNPDADAFLWGRNKDKGKNLLGAINYLSEKGMNAFSFLTFNVDGDDRNVFPHLLKIDNAEYEKVASLKDSTHQWEKSVIQDRFDVSKLDQWEQVFAYGEQKGMFLHFKTQETENEDKMNGGHLGLERKLYYRELISRFGHHLALNWNLGEENTLETSKVKNMAQYFADNDPYQSPVVIHTYPSDHEKVYRPLLGDNSSLNGVSIQTKNTGFSLVHDAVDKWVKTSAQSGKKWVVAVDEPGDAKHALLPDEENPGHDKARINALWGTLLAGGYGTEWYFGYSHPHSDLTCESWRSRDLFWEQGKIALDFFHNHKIPVTEMSAMDSITSSESDYVFAKPGEVYLVYSKYGDPIQITLPKAGFTYEWYNPKSGEALSGGATKKKQFQISCPSQQDWLLYIYQ